MQCPDYQPWSFWSEPSHAKGSKMLGCNEQDAMLTIFQYICCQRQVLYPVVKADKGFIFSIIYYIVIFSFLFARYRHRHSCDYSNKSHVDDLTRL